MSYPDGRDLYYGYGTSGSLDDVLNRVATLVDNDNNTTLATYSYQGANGIVKTELNEPSLTLDYTTSGALDRFGRVTDHVWNDGSSDIVRIKHGYDRASNRLYREDPVAQTATREWDELYSYDGVNQLTGLERGTMTATKDAILSQSKNFAENWDLDATGNWSTFKQDTNGDGTWDLNQSRAHNAANEITAIAGSASNVSHDLNGNMTTIPQPADWSSAVTLTYDAWNRLVKVEDGQTTVATYAYDGRNHRVLKTVSSTDRHVYYNQQWQCLEERTASAADIQYVWGQRYIDDLLLRDRSSERLYSFADPNWNVVALTNAGAAVQIRLRYNAYGTASAFNASYVSTSLPTNWSYTFTTRRFDAETGCMYYRNRYYHPMLGRFQKRDPIGFKRPYSLYAYVRNQAVRFVDPRGLQKQAAGGGTSPHYDKDASTVTGTYRCYNATDRSWNDYELKTTDCSEDYVDKIKDAVCGARKCVWNAIEELENQISSGTLDPVTETWFGNDLDADDLKTIKSKLEKIEAGSDGNPLSAGASFKCVCGDCGGNQAQATKTVVPGTTITIKYSKTIQLCDGFFGPGMMGKDQSGLIAHEMGHIFSGLEDEGYYDPRDGKYYNKLYAHDRRDAAVRARSFKLIQRFEEMDSPLLFNLADDIGERRNVADQHPAQVRELTTMMSAWRESTGSVVPSEDELKAARSKIEASRKK